MAATATVPPTLHTKPAGAQVAVSGGFRVRGEGWRSTRLEHLGFTLRMPRDFVAAHAPRDPGDALTFTSAAGALRLAHAGGGDPSFKAFELADGSKGLVVRAVDGRYLVEDRGGNVQDVVFSLEGPAFVRRVYVLSATQATDVDRTERALREIGATARVWWGDRDPRTLRTDAGAADVVARSRAALAAAPRLTLTRGIGRRTLAVAVDAAAGYAEVRIERGPAYMVFRGTTAFVGDDSGRCWVRATADPTAAAARLYPRAAYGLRFTVRGDQRGVLLRATGYDDEGEPFAMRAALDPDTLLPRRIITDTRGQRESERLEFVRAVTTRPAPRQICRPAPQAAARPGDRRAGLWLPLSLRRLLGLPAAGIPAPEPEPAHRPKTRRT